METYRLFEYSNFLLIPWLPITTSDNNPSNVTDCELNDVELSYLDQYYKSAVPLYGDLCSSYQQDRERARNQHRIRKFPQMKEWIPVNGLTESGMYMRSGPNRMVTTATQFLRHDSMGVTKFIVGSVVCVNNVNSPPNFGQIHLIFHHIFCGVTHNKLNFFQTILRS